ncbi:unnamed protein product [Lampetra planeri]
MEPPAGHDTEVHVQVGRLARFCPLVRDGRLGTEVDGGTSPDNTATVLDDLALAVFDRIPPAKRGSLLGVYKEVAEVFDPQSGGCQKFKNRQREASESFLVFRTELLTLAEAAFQWLNEPCLDSLVVERLLAMAEKVGVMVVEEKARTSLCAYK